MYLSIVILSYNSKHDLNRLLPSIFQSKCEFDFEVIVVDNGSKDGTLDWLETWSMEHKVFGIKTIKNSNTGFAHGNNLGIRLAQGKYILILNPDTELKQDTLQIMYDFMEKHKEVGISTCKVILPSGKLDLACRRRFPNPWNSFKRLFLLLNKDYNYSNLNEDATMEIDTCMGAFMFVRKEVFEKIGFFDEDFFMYGEDIDLCFRAKQAGFKVWYYPFTLITHFKGSSSKKTPFIALKWFHDSMWIFYKKHYADSYFFVFNSLVFLGIYFRLFGLFLLNTMKKEKFVSKQNV